MNEEYNADKTAKTADKKTSKAKTDDAKKDLLENPSKEKYEGSVRQKTGNKDK